jgi:predicted nucleotidyltransferase
VPESEKSRQIAEPNIILRVEVGSTVHGVSLDGMDDRDEMGVCLEPPHYVVGLGTFEHWQHRTALDRMKAEQAAGKDFPPNFTPRSQPGDLDLIVYSLRKWVRMALRGNPSAMMLLFSPKVIASSRLGEQLREMAPVFASRKVGKAYLGYMTQQKERLLGKRGQKDVTRNELVAKYGFDTKYAYHILRLGYQGCEFMISGKIELPLVGTMRQHLLDVRTGKVTLAEVVEEADGLEHQIRMMLEASPLPEEPHFEIIDQFVQDAYQEHWGWFPDAAVSNMAR